MSLGPAEILNEQESATSAPAITPPPLSPLVVDLDGTLLRTDLLVESCFALIKQSLLALFLLPFWFLRGRAQLKREIARRVRLNPALLPYRQPLVQWLCAERARGRTLILATASDELLAQPVAEHLGIFDAVYASDGKTNLKGSRKRDLLVEKFGAGNFVYAGDSKSDFAVWEKSGGAVPVGISPPGNAPVVQAFSSEYGGLKSFIKAIRVKQWAKNVLVFIPVLTAHRIRDLHLDVQALIGFLSFSLCASAVYLANDLMDLDADRRHRSKRERPFASGALPLIVGLVAAPLFVIVAFGLALLLPPHFGGVLALYFVITNAYTFWLKREVLLDVLCLATLYTLRIFAGAESTGVPVSMWLIALSMFEFLSLALVKRVAELRQANSEGALPGRGYAAADLEILSQAGVSSSYMAVMVFALYIHSDEVKALYLAPSILWFICPLILYWNTRVWLLTRRGKMDDDPVNFAVRDRTSYMLGALALVVASLAR